MERTKGPWRECGKARGGCECRQIWAPDADVVVAIASIAEDTAGLGVVSQEEAQANAAFIVKACNNYEDALDERDGFLAALKQIANTDVADSASRYGMKELARTIVGAARARAAKEAAS